MESPKKCHPPLLRFPVLVLALLMFPCPVEEASSLRHGCVYRGRQISADSYSRDGDLILGAVLQVYIFTFGTVHYKEEPFETTCFLPSLHYFRHLMAFVFAIEEINNNTAILPNITLGFQIYDSCGSEDVALERLLRIMYGRLDQKIIPNYSCHRRGTTMAIIGHLLSSSTYSIAGLTGIYKYPQISYGALDSVFSDRVQFPSLYRTVPDERSQSKAIVKLLQHFGWTWVGLVISEDDSNQRASEDLRAMMSRSGICIDFSSVITETNYVKDVPKTIEDINRASARVIIFYSTMKYLSMLFAKEEWKSISGRVWISAATSTILTNDELKLLLVPLNGSLMLSVHKGEIPGLKQFLQSATPAKHPGNDFIKALWFFETRGFNRAILLQFIINSFSLYGAGSNDTNRFQDEKLRDKDMSLYDVNNFRLTYSIYTAVYAVAHALHAMLNESKRERITDRSALKQTLLPWQLDRYLKSIHFKTPGGDEIFFDDKGSTPGRFDIMNLLIFRDGSLSSTQIGSFNDAAPEETQLFINESAIKWAPQYTKAPSSVCSESCSPGQRKAPQVGRQVCCHICVQCSEGEITSKYDMEECVRCPEDQWSNEKRDLCVPRVLDFLSYQDPLCMALASMAVLLSSVTAGVLWIFIKYRDTPIVKANNRDLSYTLLLSLMLSFLSAFLFLGQPITVTCILRQAAFGVIFAVAVSSILAKTVTVVIAFNATKPGSKIRKWAGSRVSICLVLLCTLGQGVICIVWMVHSPPFPDYDTRTETGTMILLCNEGSVIGFYCVVGYMGVLALLSFIVAFMARKLPNSFNEAQYITFSMLVFCSVWVSFIPAYLSTKGRYMVAVEVFAILASSSGLLGCIFIPKCHIIMLRPDLNTKKSLISK